MLHCRLMTSSSDYVPQYRKLSRKDNLKTYSKLEHIMSLSRTPPKSVTQDPPPFHGSDPALYCSGNNEQTDVNLPKRLKRKFDDKTETNLMVELRNMFEDFKNQQNKKFENLKSAITTVQEQNQEIKKSMEFLSQKYDEVLENVKRIQIESNDNKTNIKKLELKLEQMERNKLITNVVLKSIPKQEFENKQSLIEITKKICSKIDMPVQSSDIREVFRMKLKDKLGPVVVEFNSSIHKENIIKAAREYNKKNPSQRLSTSGFGFEARELVKNKNCESCWTSYGKVFIRRNMREPKIYVENEEELENLKKKI